VPISCASVDASALPTYLWDPHSLAISASTLSICLWDPHSLAISASTLSICLWDQHSLAISASTLSICLCDTCCLAHAERGHRVQGSGFRVSGFWTSRTRSRALWHLCKSHVMHVFPRMRVPCLPLCVHLQALKEIKEQGLACNCKSPGGVLLHKFEYICRFLTVISAL
jgi:hypothetical protein